MRIEIDVIKDCMNRDRKAQKKVFETYKEIFTGIAIRYVNRIDIAKDVVQESFIKIFEKLPQLKDPEAFDSWARRLVVNTAINAYYKKKSLKNLIITKSELEYSGIDLQNSLIKKMDAKILFELISKMPEGYKVIFNLYLVDGYSHQEIADMLGIAKSTSRSQLFKSKRYLQNKIEELNMEFS